MDRPTYAVVWQDAGALRAPLYAGKLELGEHRLRLEGTAAGRSVQRTLEYEELGDVHMAGARERIAGRPTLVVEPTGGVPLRLGSVDGRGLLAELADELITRVFGPVRTA